MKKIIKPIVFLNFFFATFSYSQVNFNDALNYQQMAKELYYLRALAVEVEGYWENVTLKHDKTLDKIASQKASSLLNDIENNKQIFRGNNKTNFYLFEWSENEEIDDELIQSSIVYASKEWARIEFDGEIHDYGDKQYIDNHDIDELYNILRAEKVGFGYAKKNNKLIVTSLYD